MKEGITTQKEKDYYRHHHRDKQKSYDLNRQGKKLEKWNNSQHTKAKDATTDDVSNNTILHLYA